MGRLILKLSELSVYPLAWVHAHSQLELSPSGAPPAISLSGCYHHMEEHDGARVFAHGQVEPLHGGRNGRPEA